MATNEIMYIGCLRGSLHLHPSVPGKPTAFHSWKLSGLLSGSGAVGLGAQLDVETPDFSEGTSWPLKHLSGTAAATMGAQAAFLHHFCTPHQSHCGEGVSSVLGYKASLQLAFSWLFRMISLQFSCNSRLALGGG